MFLVIFAVVSAVSARGKGGMSGRMALIFGTGQPIAVANSGWFFRAI